MNYGEVINELISKYKGKYDFNSQIGWIRGKRCTLDENVLDVYRATMLSQHCNTWEAFRSSVSWLGDVTLVSLYLWFCHSFFIWSILARFCLELSLFHFIGFLGFSRSLISIKKIREIMHKYSYLKNFNLENLGHLWCLHKYNFFSFLLST